MKPVLLDTGFIVALLDRGESFHKMCARTVREVASPLVTCEAVITESCYLLRNLSGASEAVIENIAAGIFQVPFQLSRETAGVKQVLRKYKDREIDLADACLIRLADEFGTADISTLDQDFAIYPLGQKQTISNAAERGLTEAKKKTLSHGAGNKRRR